MCYSFKYVRQATRDDRPPVYFPNHRFRGRNQTFVLEICARFSPVLQTKIQEGRIEKKSGVVKKYGQRSSVFPRGHGRPSGIELDVYQKKGR